MTRGDGAWIPALKHPQYVFDTFISSVGERSFPFLSLSETAARFPLWGTKWEELRPPGVVGFTAPGRPLRLAAD